MVLSCQIKGGKCLTFGKLPTICSRVTVMFLVQSGGTESCIWMTLPCWEGRTLSRWPLRGWYAIQSVPQGRSQSSMKDLSQKLTEHPWRTVMPVQERGGPQTPLGRQRHIWRGTVWCDWSPGEWNVWQFSIAMGTDFYFDTTALMLDSSSKVHWFML